MRPRRKRLTRKDKQPDFGSTLLPSAIARRRVASVLTEGAPRLPGTVDTGTDRRLPHGDEGDRGADPG